MRKAHLAAAFALLLLAAPVGGQEKEFQLNGFIQLQGGLFVPMATQGFQDYDNLAFFDRKVPKDEGLPCWPISQDVSADMSNITRCVLRDHGGKAGEPSMLRGTIQLMMDWRPQERVNVHGVLRMVRSLQLDLDQFAQTPTMETLDTRRSWVADNYYNEIDLREFYVDIEATDWLSFRIGRQQVTWGDINSFRLLDVVNAVDNSWHFGPMEAFDDTRIPLWIWKTLIEIQEWDHSLEIVWVPGLDRPRDMVSPPLTFMGTWGLPLPDSPPATAITEKVFRYPGRDIDDQRIGARWRGNITPASTYTLVYYYTHVISPPIPTLLRVNPDNGDSTLLLDFPRQHIAGFAVDYAFESPVAMVAKLEASIEPDRTYPSNIKKTLPGNAPGEATFLARERFTANYAIQLMRPTMIRWLNPTQNFLFVLQFQHSFIPTLKSTDTDLLNIPGYDNYPVAAHNFTGVFAAATSYLHGILTPRLTVANSWSAQKPVSGGKDFSYGGGFVMAELGVRLGRDWRLRLQLIDIWGPDPFKSLGFFRDRDEINLQVTYQF